MTGIQVSTFLAFCHLGGRSACSIHICLGDSALDDSIPSCTWTSLTSCRTPISTGAMAVVSVQGLGFSDSSKIRQHGTPSRGIAHTTRISPSPDMKTPRSGSHSPRSSATLLSPSLIGGDSLSTCMSNACGPRILCKKRSYQTWKMRPRPRRSTPWPLQSTSSYMKFVAHPVNQPFESRL